MNTHTSTSSGQVADKVTFGFWVYLMSDLVVFAGLFATYFVLRGATFGGAEISDIVDLPFVLTETLLLLISSFTMGLALYFATESKKSVRSGALAQVLPTFLALIATLLLGLGFLGMEVSEFMKLIAEGNGPSRSAFLSAFFTLLGTHGLHVALGSIWMLVVMVHVAVRGLGEKTLSKIMCLSLFWHFLDIIWIFIFTMVYLFGALAL